LIDIGLGDPISPAATSASPADAGDAVIEQPIIFLDGGAVRAALGA
jgi:hypothetical protein